MRKTLLAVCITIAATPVFGQANTVTNWQTGTTSTGAPVNAPVSNANPLPVAATITLSGTQNVNVQQVNGATVNVGTGAAGTGTQRVTTSTDSTIGTVTAVTAITNALPAGANVIGHVIVDSSGLPTGAATSALQTSVGATAHTDAGTINTTLGSPFQASGFIGNTSFIATSPVGITPTDGTVTSATGSSQTVFASLATRHGLIVQNTGNANCGINPTGGTAVIGGAATLTLFPGGSYQPRIPTLSAVTAICTSGQSLYAEQN